MKWTMCFLIILSGIFLLGGCVTEASPEDRLTETQISELRDEYPICGVNSPPLVETITPKFSQVKERIETFVYGEVIGGSSEFYRRSFEFFEYPIKVIEDTEGEFKSGEQITIASSIMFKDSDYKPRFREGMQVVVPVIEDEEKAGRCFYSVHGIYYVTEEGYVISAFDEEAAEMETPLSGIRVESLLKKLKK